MLPFITGMLPPTSYPTYLLNTVETVEVVEPGDDWQGVRSCGRRRVAMLGHCLAAEKKAMTMQYWVSGTDRAVRVVWEAG